MRGKAQDITLDCGKFRITPAYAGKRHDQRETNARHRDHPRICGEKLNKAKRKEAKKGSPPHMRGKVSCFVVYAWYMGITPAYAGKSQ